MRVISVKRFKNKSGAALIMVIVLFAVISIMFATIGTICEANLRQAKAQENNLKTYYLALSGSDLCFTSLLQEGPGGANDTLLYNEFGPDVTNPRILTDDNLMLTGGTVKIQVQAINVNGVRWVQITSTATLDASSTQKTTIFKFQVSNPSIHKTS